MAKIGLNNFRYGKLTELSDGTFSYADAKSPGKAVSCNVSVTNNSATLYADDELAENYTGYQNATVSITIDEEDIETYSDLLGHTITDEGEVVANSNDVAPYIGFGRIITKMVNGVIKYKVQFLYKAKFTEPNKEENTKGESIEFGTYTLEGGVYTLPDGRWTKEKTFERKEDAIAYLNSQFESVEIYYGAAPDLSDVTSLTSIKSSNKTRTITVDAGEGEYIIYAYPKRLGTVEFWVGQFEGGFDAPVEMDLENSYGLTETYYVYKSENADLGETTIEIKEGGA